jgi:hypothetical protein
VFIVHDAGVVDDEDRLACCEATSCEDAETVDPRLGDEDVRRPRLPPDSTIDAHSATPGQDIEDLLPVDRRDATHQLTSGNGGFSAGPAGLTERKNGLDQRWRPKNRAEGHR